MYNRHRFLFSCLLFCAVLTFFSFRPGGTKDEKKKWVVVIDAGHGGKDPGCHGKRFKEKDVALAVTLKFGHYLEQNNKDVTVVYTRKTDVFVPLNERAEIANRNHADFFICIHCNASPDHDADGAATYVMGLNKSEGNLEVSKRENSSVLLEKDYKRTYDGFDPNSDEAAVLFAMYQNIYLNQSLDMSGKIQKEYNTVVKTNDNGVKQAGFLVLWKTAMPSLLTEIGFLTNPDEEKILGSQKGEDEIAKSIFLAFEQYKAEKDGSAYKPDTYDLKPLVVNNMPDTVMNSDTTSGEKPVANEEKEEDKQPVKVDSVPQEKPVKKPVVEEKKAEVPVKKVVAEENKEVKPAKKDTADIKVQKMQEAIKSLHTDSSIAVNKFTPAIDSAVKNDTTKIVYKVQFAVSPHPLSVKDSKYANIPDIDMYLDNTTYKYTAGHYYVLKDAVDLQATLRNNGYKDAFVVTFKGNKRVILTKLSSK